MSFEIYFQRFKAGQMAGFPRCLVEEVFGWAMVTEKRNFSFTPLVYPSGAAGDMHIADTEEISSFTILDPATDELFDDLFILMKRIGAIIYWPDSAPCLAVATKDVEADLPSDMLAALGPGILVMSGRDIVMAIKGAL